MWPEHRLYAVGTIVKAFDDAGIFVHARTLRYRAMLQFFGPYAPVEIMVPAADATRASAIVEERLMQADEPG